ncbi:MAG: ABC transporter permease [Planctomycetota bacterium]|nr:ABC transporter permease [Planctomycetota bacterium]
MLIATLRLAVRNLLLHKLRSILTLLGTILGVASVISMLSIGEGSKQEALEQIRRLGAANVIIRSMKPQQSSNQTPSSTSTYVLAYGLTYTDLKIIKDLQPEGCAVVPSVMHKKNLQHAKRHVIGVRIVATTEQYPVVREMAVKGRFFNADEVTRSANVVVVGQKTANELFGFEDPIGKSLLVGDDAYRVIGVIAYGDSGSAKATANDTADQNADLYIPITSAQNRMGIVQRLVETGSRQYVRIELSEITIRLKDQSQVRPFASVVRNILTQKHSSIKDYEVQVPLDLLNQAEREKRLWNMVLGSIAGISLLVGGIGIMNIMLATVTERTREIGIRRAIGAKRRHIIMQFLMETTVLSTSGGILGVIVGVLIPILFTLLLGITTSTSIGSIVVAFGISVATGIVFGVYPAYKAASMNPIEALRHQ